MADAALSAKTLVAEVRARGARVRGARRAGLPGLLPSPALKPRSSRRATLTGRSRAAACAPQNRLKEATEATRLAAEARPPGGAAT